MQELADIQVEVVAIEPKSKPLLKGSGETVTMKAPEDYITDHAEAVNKPSRVGYISVPIAEFLVGRPWNEEALQYMHCFQPSAIRVSDGWLTCDGYSRRITVITDPDTKLITKITQEVTVPLLPDQRWGADVRLHYGLENVRGEKYPLVLELDHVTGSKIAAVTKLTTERSAWCAVRKLELYDAKED